jgi:high-affinity iron transporter
MSRRRHAILVTILIAALAPLRAAEASRGTLSPEARADVRRFLLVLAGVRDEYGEALDEAGRVVRPIEIEEARLLVADGRDVLRRVGDVLPDDAGAVLDRIEADLGAGTPADELAGVVDDLRSRVQEATGVSDVAPHVAPSAVRGAALFADNCAGCHGPTGHGDGPEAARLGVKPANFSDPTFMRAETPQDFFNVLSLGRRRSGMPAWDESLSVQERWDLIAHLFTLVGTPAAAGADAYRSACASCHGAALEGTAGVAPLDDPLALVRRSEDDLVRLLDDAPHAASPAVTALSPESRRRIAAWVQRTSLASAPAEPGDSEPSPATSLRGLADARRLLQESLDAATRGDATAAELATQAYVALSRSSRAFASGAAPSSIVSSARSWTTGSRSAPGRTPIAWPPSRPRPMVRSGRRGRHSRVPACRAAGPRSARRSPSWCAKASRSS